MSKLFNTSNILSALRGPLALIFLWPSPWVRGIVIVLAMVTDCLDGFLARRWHQTSQFGAMLDPLMDKFFVIFLLGVLFSEGDVEASQIAALLCRDFAVVLFGIYLYTVGEWSRYRFRAIWSGKVTTTLQFFVLLALSLSYPIPEYVYPAFVVLGVFALIELYFMARQQIGRDS